MGAEMANTHEFTIEGVIQKIMFASTRRGARYARVHVKGSLANMDVMVFDKKQVSRLLSAKPGDRVKSTGSGRHTGGSIKERGNTALTARLLRITKDEAARAAASPANKPQQLSLI